MNSPEEPRVVEISERSGWIDGRSMRLLGVDVDLIQLLK